MLSFNRLGLLLLLGVCLLLPFELRRPVLQTATFQLTNLEVGVYCCLALGLILQPQIQSFWRWSLVCLGLVLCASLVSSQAAAAQKIALFATFRFAIGVLFALAVATIAQRNPGQRHWIYAALLLGAGAAATLGIFEVLRNQPLAGLNILRERATTVGPFLRLTSSFDHANQAAMYLEALVPVGIFATYQAWQRQQKAGAIGLALLTLILFQSALLTLSRASFATLIMVSGGLWGVTWLAQKRALARYLAVCTSVMLVILALNILLHPVLQLRLQSEGDDAWYQARFSMPATVTGTAAAAVPVTVDIQNDGLLTWSEELEHPIRLGAHWYAIETDSATLLATEPRWRFPAAVAPQSGATWTLALVLPETPGTYRLEWDVVHENITWFSQKNGNVATTLVTVTAVGAATPSAATSVTSQARSVPLDETLLPPIPHRRTLWGAAFLLWQDAPWLGIGLDNFRLQYGPVLEMAHFNDTIHTNNWYVEMLVSLGLLGALPFFLWLALLAMQFLKRARTGAVPLLQLGVGAGLLTFMLHGVLDYFLLFNGTAFLFWALVGLWGSYETSRA